MPSLTDRTPVGNHISVCICTYKRAVLLSNLLEKLQEQHTDSLFTYSAVIVDNDVNESAKTVVETFKQKSSFNIDYFIEPKQNISLARNKAVGSAIGNFIALIDDDEYPGPSWLLNFYKTLTDSKADGALGPVVPYYPAGIPKWIIKSKIWEMRSRKTGTILNWPETRTSNVFLNRNVFEGQGKPFDPRFGLTGGEDQDFFKRMMNNGRCFEWCNEAEVYEVISPERWSRSFYLKKYMQMGGRTGELAKKWPFRSRCKWSAKSILAMSFYSLVLPFSFFIGQHVFMKCLLKCLYFFGWFTAFLWRPIIKFRY
jgi:glycosyltransferase involved in cell wall biosynthesis